MAATNHERIGIAMEALKDGLGRYVLREYVSQYKARSVQEVQAVTGVIVDSKEAVGLLDTAALLKLMWDRWNEVFRETLGNAVRNLVSELRTARNDWAHQKAFSSDETYRVLDSTILLLNAVSAPQAGEIEKLREELLRVKFSEQARTERRRASNTLIENQGTANLKPWRAVVSPHTDVASGRFQKAEFAADLWQVHTGEGADEYKDPIAFFNRTYITDSLKRLLETGIERMSGSGGVPVVQLQTNFGGGKTHSMLALYHLFSGVAPTEMSGVEDIMSDMGDKDLPSVNRVVLVGNKISPGNPVTKPDGTVVHTLWGELAWQLGGKTAYQRIQSDDEKATNPGDVLRELINDYSPCLILIDEWVAYARQLHDEGDLPAGDFETQFTFAQTLTESAKDTDKCLLAISLPSSDTLDATHAEVDAVEVGGARGRRALERLSNIIDRVAVTWRPASAEESFEIVRRRLFEPLIDREQHVARDATARAFFDLYQTQQQEFPPECHEADYEKRIAAAYPIHPEVFDRLYSDWSTLVKFQRTRGVLRLMSSVIHSLWESGDQNPMILPANISIDDPLVQSELTRYLPENWVPIIEKDVDGPNSLPHIIDAEVPNLGRFGATRRVARSIYLGSAPIPAAANLGIEDRRIKLGCVMPGESPAIFGDALRRLSSRATFLYQDSTRFWYSTQPTVTKLAEDKAELLKREPGKVLEELDKRIRNDLTQLGDFSRVHPLPGTPQDVPDDTDARLVVLGLDHSYSREPNNPGEVAARSILESKGNSPRIYRNTLTFLAPDSTRKEELEDATRRYLAWAQILGEKESLDLTQNMVRQAETQMDSADKAITARIPETYHWLLVPSQNNPEDPLEFQSIRLTGQGSLAARASRRLANDDLLIANYGPTLLRMELDRVWWRSDDHHHVEVRQLVEDFAKYNYLPRLKDPAVLAQAIQSGISMMTWEQDSFAFAEGYDEAADRYQGLRTMEQISVSPDAPGLVVRPARARQQLDLEKIPLPPTDGGTTCEGYGPIDTGNGTGSGGGISEPPVTRKARRYHGSVNLDPIRVGRDASQIADEVIAHLSGLMGAKVTVRIEIEAEIPEGAPDNVVRIVTENSQALKFGSHGFEEE